MKKLFLLPLISLLFTSCYVSKTLDREVKITLDESFEISMQNNGNSNFTGGFTADEYRAAFIEGMKAEFASSKIVIVQDNPEFMVSISELKIEESTKTETVNDTESDDHGKEFELTTIDMNSKGLVDQVEKEHIKEWYAEKEKSEKVTNSRSAGQVITGDNKDRKTYREKEFDSNEALDLAEKCGRRSGARIINDIIKAIK